MVVMNQHPPTYIQIKLKQSSVPPQINLAGVGICSSYCVSFAHSLSLLIMMRGVIAKRLGDNMLGRLRHPCRSHCFGTETGGSIRRLEGKIALITGAASGLGKATAHEFIRHGAQVIIADVDSQLGSQVTQELGPEAHFVQCDVTVEAQVKEAVDLAISRYGKLDIMHNNAGITGPVFPYSIADIDLEEFDKVMQVNVRAMIAGIKHASRVMIPAGTGSILCTSSISGLMGGLGPHPYSISKFAIHGVVKTVASELCRAGVRINCISPGPIPTPMSLGQIGMLYPGATKEQIVEVVKGLGDLKGVHCEEVDVAKAALYLASEEAKYITGHNLVVDGGFTSFKNLPLPSLHDVL